MPRGYWGGGVGVVNFRGGRGGGIINACPLSEWLFACFPGLFQAGESRSSTPHSCNAVRFMAQAHLRPTFTLLMLVLFDAICTWTVYFAF